MTRPREDDRHDVAIVALAIIGAVALVVGAMETGTPRFTSIPVGEPGFDVLRGVLAVIAAGAATWACMTTLDDVTATEAVVAIAIAVPLAHGIVWSPPGWRFDGAPHVLAGFTVAAMAGAYAMVRMKQPVPLTARLAPALVAAFVTGGVGALFVLAGYALHLVTGLKLDVVPWLAVAVAAALLAWRAPVISIYQVYGGHVLACTGAIIAFGRMTLPDDQRWLVAIVGPVVGAVIAIAGAFVHDRVTRRLRRRTIALAKAELR